MEKARPTLETKFLFIILPFSSVLQDDNVGKENDDLYIRSVCFSPDGKFIATGAEDKQIRVSYYVPFARCTTRQLISNAHIYVDLGYQQKTYPSLFDWPRTRYLLIGFQP
jgi:WD40 repeat protein